MKQNFEIYEGLDLEQLYEIPGYSRYLADLKNGRIWDKQKETWKQAAPNFNQYCFVNVVSNTGKKGSVGVHVLVMKALFAIESGHDFDWGMLNLEVDHINHNRSENSVNNLRLLPVPVNRARRYMPKSTNRLDQDAVKQLREEYKTIKHGEKMQWFKQKGEEYDVSFRTVQNNCLNYVNI